MKESPARSTRPKRVHLHALQRLRSLVDEIARGHYPTCKVLAEKLERSTRTIRRDIDSLRNDFNAPVEFDRERNGFYFTDPAWRLPPVRMTEAELIAFFSAERVLRRVGRTPDADIARNTLGSLVALLPNEVVVDVSKLYDAVRYAPAPALDADPEILAHLAAAAAAKRTLAIEYYSPSKDERTRREIDVLLLHERLGEWYAVSWDHKSGEYRDFHAGRVLDIQDTDRTFSVPESWDADEYLRSGFGMFRGGEPVTVSVVFDDYQARYARERRYHETQRTTELDGGGLRIEFDTTENALEQVARWVMGYGRHAWAERPERLRQIIAEHLRDARVRYGN